MAVFSFEFYPKSLARKKSCDLLIPSLNLHGALANQNDDYYCTCGETYPLMICLCGFGDNEKSWQQNTAILSLCEKYKVAACFVNGDNKWYLDMGPIDNYYDYLERDLPDFLYGNFSFLSKERPLMILGVSMGGYGALYHYLRNDEKYAACIALSPAVKPDYIDESRYGTLRELALKGKDRPKHVYLSVGSEDFIIGASKEFDEDLHKIGAGFSYRFIPGADHSWATWRNEIFNVFEYLSEQGFISR